MRVTKFLHAINEGNALGVLRYINDKNINRPDADGITPLMKAIILSRNEIAEILIRAGADVNFPDISGNTPLMYCAMRGNTEVARMLIDSGADPHFTSFEKKNALKIAEFRGDAAFVSLIKFYSTRNGRAVKDYKEPTPKQEVSTKIAEEHFREPRPDLNSPTEPDVEEVSANYVPRDFIDVQRIREDEDHQNSVVLRMIFVVFLILGGFVALLNGCDSNRYSPYDDIDRDRKHF